MIDEPVTKRWIMREGRMPIMSGDVGNLENVFLELTADEPEIPGS